MSNDSGRENAVRAGGWRQRLLSRWAAVCYDHAWVVVAAVVVLTAFFGYFGATIEINLGFLALLDENDPLVQRVNDANQNFGGLDYLHIALTMPDGEPADKERLIRYAKQLVPRLRERTDLIGRVVARVDLDAMIRWAPLFLNDEDLDEFVRETTERRDDLARLFADTRLVPVINEMNATLEREIIEEDEITDEDEALRSLRAMGRLFDTAWTYLREADPETDAGPAKRSLRKLLLPEGDGDLPDDDYYFFDQDRMLIVRAMSAKPADDYIYIEQVMAMVDEQIAAVDREVPGVRVLLAGNMPIMRDEHQALVGDMKFTTIASMILVLIIFAVVFRKVTDLALIAICLLAGLGITFGLTEFAIGYLSLLTAFFAAIMIGLGIDFAIHVISRYGEEIRRGRAVRDAVIGAIAGAGPGVLTGGVTTAAAFLVLMMARFKGLAQLGFVSGVGILVMLFLMFTLLPAMISLRDRRKVPAELTIKSIGDSVPLGRLADLAIRHPWSGGIVVALICAAAVFGVTRSSFNYNYRELEPRGAVSLEAIREVEQRLEKSIDYAMLVTDSVEESRTLAAAAEKLSTVKEVESITDFIPTKQAAKNARLRELAPVLGPMTIAKQPTAADAYDADGLRALAAAARGSARVTRAVLQLAILGGQFEIEDLARNVETDINDFAARVEAAAQRPTAAAGATRYQGFVAAEMAALLDSLKLAAAGEELTVERLPKAIRDNFVGKDGRLAVYIYPNGDVWQKEFMARHNGEVASVDASAVSIVMLFEEIFNNIIEDFRSSMWYSLAAVFLLVLIDFRRLRTSLLALVPLVSGALWMVGVMPVLGMQFNLVNVAIVPLILGIGIDNGVHILHRYRMETENRVHLAVEHTGKAILLSSLTTMAGFGMLALASYVAIGSLGQVLVVGVGTCFFTSVFVLPLILARFDRRGWKV